MTEETKRQADGPAERVDGSPDPFIMSPADESRFDSEFQTVKHSQGSLPIYGYVGVASVLALFFANLYKDGIQHYISYVLAGLAVVNAMVISSFAYTSLQIQELKQFQTRYSRPDSAQAKWEFEWRRTKRSATRRIRWCYYGFLYILLGCISILLVSSAFWWAHSWFMKLACVIAGLAQLIPARIIIHEETFVKAQWERIRKELSQESKQG